MGRDGLRWLLAVTGVALMGGALIWAWRNDEEGVVLAALGVGAFMVYLAYSGQHLKTFKLPGGVEAELADAVQTTLESPDVPDPVKNLVVDRLPEEGALPPELRKVAKRVRTTRRAAMGYQAEVQDQLRAIADKHAWQLDAASSGAPYDAYIKSGRGAVAVEVRYSTVPPDPQQFARWVGSVASAAGDSKGLLVVRYKPQPMPTLPKAIHVVDWARGADTAALEQKLESLFVIRPAKQCAGAVLAVLLS